MMEKGMKMEEFLQYLKTVLKVKLLRCRQAGEKKMNFSFRRKSYACKNKFYRFDICKESYYNTP